MKLRSKYFSSKIDNKLLRAVLYQNDDDAERWGVRKHTYFSNILLSISDGNLRYQRSTVKNLNHTTLTDLFDEVSDNSRPSPRYGHAACGASGLF